jgi:hypothetical protein
MAKLKTYLMQLQEQQMNDAELDSYIELLHEDWLAKHEAYSYEDNYKPFEVKAKAPNNVREGGDE